MCGPAAFIVGASALGAMSQVQQGKAAKQAGEYNAQAQEIRGQEALNRADRDLAKHRRSVAAFKARQTATMAASGVDISQGSATRILSETEMMAQVDAENIIRNAEMEAQGAASQATMDRYQGAVGQQTSYLSAGGTVLGGASQLYGNQRGV